MGPLGQSIGVALAAKGSEAAPRGAQILGAEVVAAGTGAAPMRRARVALAGPPSVAAPIRRQVDLRPLGVASAVAALPRAPVERVYTVGEEVLRAEVMLVQAARGA